jgi:hypothetical protein
LPGILPGKSVRRGRAFRAGILPARKGVALHGNARCAAWSSPPHRRPGAPEEQARIVRARSNGQGVASSQLLLSFLLLRAGSALLYPGPLWRGGRVAESPQDGSQGCEPVFRRDRSPVEKPRHPPAYPQGRMPGGRAIGVPFLFGYFLFGHAKRK